MALGGGKGFGPKGARGEGGGGIGGGGGGGKTKGAGAFSDAGYANQENTGYRAGAQVGGVRGPGSSVSTGGLGGGGSNINPDGTYRGLPFGRPRTKPAAITKNYPSASPSIPFGAMVDMLGLTGPLGWAGLAGRIGSNAVNGGPFSTGFGMDAALANGGTLGAPGNPAGVGHDWSGDGLFYTDPQKKKPENGGLLTSAPSAPSPQAESGTQFKLMNFGFGFDSVPSPFGYQYPTARWL